MDHSLNSFWRIQVLDPQTKSGAWYVLREIRPYTIGRAPDNDFIIAHKDVSRYHARLIPHKDGWLYQDLDSTNGTWLGEQSVDEIVLYPGMRLRLGRHGGMLIVQGPATLSREAHPHQTSTGFVNVLSTATQTSPQKTRVLIGRSSKADISLASPVVSRRHALLKRKDRAWYLQDLNSRNGTFVNGQRIYGSQRLKTGDRIQIGSFRLLYQGGGQLEVLAAANGLRLDGVNLIWDVGKKNKKKRILHNINISCYPKEFVALVGGSGAGKSSLMKTLSGLIQPSAGTVLVEGENLHQTFDAYRTQIGYVPQDDILHRDLTVEQALQYSAQLRLPDISSTEIAQRIDKVLQQVELSGQRHQLIRSLSGGQRKRASIAVELLADPPLFFLDEPTSGLDPGLDKKMMKTLRSLADDGKTILLVTHATGNITECDQVAFMSQGRLVYYGPPREATTFFNVKDENFADIYTAISDPDPQKAKQVAHRWEQKFKKSHFYKHYVQKRLQEAQQYQHRAAAPEKKSPPYTLQILEALRQLFLLTIRYLQLIWRDRVLLTILLAIMPLLAGLVLLIAKPNWLVGDSPATISQLLQEDLLAGQQSATYAVVGNAQALLLIMSLAAVLLGLFSSAYEIVKERSIYRRERMVFLKLIPYLGSKVLPLAGIAAVQTLLFLWIVHFKVTYPQWGVFLPAFLEMYISLFLGALAAIMLGLFVSAISPNINTVVYTILGILFAQILFAGVLFELPQSAANLSKLALTRWTTEALGITVNMHYLDSLTKTRFQPDPITDEVSFDVEKPAPDWEPVTVTTELQTIDGCTNPVPMPVVTENEMETVTETVSEEVTISPDPVDMHVARTFVLDYTFTPQHLVGDWMILLGFAGFFFGLTIMVLKKQDIV